MQGTVLYGPRDIRFEDRETPKIVEPTDAVIRIAVTCVCGSDLWPYRGLQAIDGPTPMGHEYCGLVEEVGSAVRSLKPGQFVIGSFATSDNTCPHCQYGYQSSCARREFISRAQAPILRVPHAEGTLVATPGIPSNDLLPSLLTTSDVLGTGWFAADAARVKPGATAAVVGDGADGLLAVLSAKQMGAERITPPRLRSGRIRTNASPICRFSKMNANAVEVLRDRKLKTPEAANMRVKAMRQVFKWAVAKGYAPINPAREVPYLKSASEGFHTWTLDEIQQFEEHHPIGGKARLAFALLLYTGQRRSDVIRFGKQHTKRGVLTFTQYKGRNRKPHKLTLPILPVLQKVIDASPCGDMTFLVNDLGRAFTDAGFGNKFRDWCDQARSAHGLRKAGATVAANNGATARQLMAIFGWDTIKQAEHYTRKSGSIKTRRSRDALARQEVEP